jgi:hypothetical protein
VADVLVRGQVGPATVGDGTFPPPRLGRSGEQVVTELHGRYFEQVFRGNVYTATVSAGGATAYTGGAGGTPLVAIHNPTGSGVVLVALFAAVSQRAAATAAGSMGFALFAGTSALPTGTTTAPRSALSWASGGSKALSFLNTALTGSTALNLALPLGTLAVGAAAAALGAVGLFDIAGAVIAIPGNEIAFGSTVASPTGATLDAALFWEEIPYP